MLKSFTVISNEKYVINALFSLHKCISTSSYPCFSKEAKIMLKLLSKGSKKRASWHHYDDKPTLSEPVSLTKGGQNQKRVVVLNKLFMKHITDLMATGSTAKEISGMGIEVTRVKVGSDYNIVNVHWVSYGNCPENVVSNVLKKTAHEVRQELCNLRVMGKVPEIQFVRDRSIAKWASVEAALATADFGEDYVPRGITSLKSDFGNECIPAATVDEKRSLDAEEMPPMRQNVMGLNRADILQRVKESMKGQSSATRTSKQSTDELQYETFDQEAFSQFLLQRKIMKDKMERESRRESRLLEVVDYQENIESTVEEEDYIEEDDDGERK